MSVVAGAANNQLNTVADGHRLLNCGILYAPDFVINAGGVISTALEGPSFQQSELTRRMMGIGKTLSLVFERAKEDDRPTNEIADAMAQERLAAARSAKE